MVKIGFLENKLTIRGTSTAMYDYAHYNETLLGNTSVIITRRPQDSSITTKITYNKFAKRFPIIYYTFPEELDNIVVKYGIDILYVIKGGNSSDGLYTSKCKCVIHCVFDLNHKHGDVYATISNSVNRLYGKNYPIVPHLISINNTTDNLRKELGIPVESKVFGYYGGNDSFNIDFVKSLVIEENNSDIRFIFMNIDKFCDSPYVIFLEGTNDSKRKKLFINTCDALLHARERGETFGLVCGEFAISGKPVITYGNSPEDNHIELLGSKALIYRDQQELKNIIQNFNHNATNPITGYHRYASPEYVMGIFKSVFIN